MIARDALIQEAREKLAALTAQGEWREGLAGHYNVVAFDGDNVTGVAQAVGPHVRAFIIAAPRLIRDLLTLIDQGWQSIETAPKDGTRFIACGPRVAAAECEWREPFAHYPAGWYRTNQHPVVDITHWQALPAPPIGGSGQTDETTKAPTDILTEK